MLNKRKHKRYVIQQRAKSDLLQGNTDFVHRFRYKPTIVNLSFGGLGLLFVPAIETANLALLQSGKCNLFVEFNLPPSAKMLEITGKLKWSRQKTYGDISYSLVGIEFLHKTQELYREIDKFLKAPAPYSELFKNKRSFPRINSDLKTEFTIPGIKKFRIFPKTFYGTLSNISAIGALVQIRPRLTDRELQILSGSDNLITLKFQLPGLMKNVSVEARPVHLRNTIQAGMNHTTMGVRFVNMPESLQIKFVEFVSVRKVAFLKSEIEVMQNP